MPETPNYETVPSPQYRLYRDGVHVGYRVSIVLRKEQTTHEEAVDVITGPELAHTLATGNTEAFTEWYMSQLDEHDLVAAANAFLDAV